MAKQILLQDTFTQWLEKINEATDELNQLVLDGDSNVGFSYDIIGSAGLTARFFAGRVRDGSNVESIDASLITLPPSASSVVCIYKGPDSLPAELRVYLTTEIPTRYVIPLWAFTTSTTSTLTYTDLRTQFSTSSGSIGTIDGILLFDRLIERDITVPTAKAAMSISPIIAEGNVVTVEDGGEWVVI